ncbi:MarR family transcriptional regulator [Desulfosporosinus sp. OT]|uniref:MarR family winged helix-turn-helix transcriptional regulator n=1 Tax=Desulfosporosinus sp. OT TaxID=913865 RepID=UPI0002239FB4|nr:MarR family transcriptional regulator [Desulfosporosinus sp. OT]EGW40044.1 marR family protein [Desulfosporosinus sp. OT]
MAKKSQELAQDLLQIFSQFKRPSGQQPFTKLGIKPSEFILLNMLLKDCDDPSVGMRVSEISEKLDITPGGVTHTINSLEKGGFIERSADPNDRRIVLVRATEKCQKVIKRLYAEQLQFVEGLVTFLGEQDSREFTRLFSKALDYFKESRRK